MWMNESKNRNSTVWQMMPKLLCFKDAKSPIICYLLFVFTFVCCFVRYYGVALVSWLGDGAILAIQLTIFMGSVSDSSWR
jgi:hypothetical protein